MQAQGRFTSIKNLPQYSFVFIVVLLILPLTLSAEEKRVIILYKDVVTNKEVEALGLSGAKIKYQYNIIPAIAAYVDEKDIDKIKSEKTLKLFLRMKLLRPF